MLTLETFGRTHSILRGKVRQGFREADGDLFSTRRFSGVHVSLSFIAFAGKFTAETQRTLRYAENIFKLGHHREGKWGSLKSMLRLETHTRPESCTVKQSSLRDYKSELSRVVNVVEWISIKYD